MRDRGLRIVRFDVGVWLGAALAAWPFAARAGECGAPTPEYQAERTVTVGGSTVRMRVYVAGATVREESDTPDGARVTVRDMKAGRTTVLDPRTGRSTAVPAPPQPASTRVTRILDESGPDGVLTRIVQLQRGSTWLELSRTTCRRDGVMVRRSFVSLDPQGREVEGTLTQERVRVGPLAPDLFRLSVEVQPDKP